MAGARDASLLFSDRIRLQVQKDRLNTRIPDIEHLLPDQTSDEELLPTDIIIPVMYPGRTLCCFTRNTYVNRPTHHWYMTTELSELEITITMMPLTLTR